MINSLFNVEVKYETQINKFINMACDCLENSKMSSVWNHVIIRVDVSAVLERIEEKQLDSSKTVGLAVK